MKLLNKQRGKEGDYCREHYCRVIDGCKSMSENQVIFKVNDEFRWLREPLLMRMPDGSLLCEIFTGGPQGDGGKDNVIAAVRSDDDGQSWSGIEVIKEMDDAGCWAGSVFRSRDSGYIFWQTLENDRSETSNHLLYTNADGSTFADRRIMQNWNGKNAMDVRRGIKLRSGKTLLPVAWHEPLNRCITDDEIKLSAERSKRLANVGGARIVNKIAYCGVVEPNEGFTEFTRHGRICHLTPDGEIPCVPFFENQIAELSDGNLAMLIRGDLTNRLWRSDSTDGGFTWSEPYITDIKNPGSKTLIVNLPDGRIVLIHNPSEKDYSDTESHHHRYRTPLEIWVSDDDMVTWSTHEVLGYAPDVAQYPDGFYDHKNSCIYLVWENNKEVFFKKVSI